MTTTILGPVAFLAATLGGNPPVLVALDMDASRPGRQSSVTVPACTGAVTGVAVFMSDPLGTRQLFTIGYLGGIDRGIALGHTPDPDLNQGCVTAVSGQLVAPVNAGNTAWMVTAPGIDPGFAGPEVQYVEFGAGKSDLIGNSGVPLFTATIELAGAVPGDAYRFYLLDKVAVWGAGGDIGGAISTTGQWLTLDTGGDAVPDGTDSIAGIDADGAVPVPPAAYLVDYVDGPAPAGPALVIVVAAPADLDADGEVGITDLLALLGEWGACDGPECPGDLDGDGAIGITDLLALLASWGGCDCP